MPRPAGIHLPWSEVPAEPKQWIAASLGSDVVDAHDLSGGFSPGCCTLLKLANGRQVFVKAVGEELNPESVTMHRREARIAEHLPDSPSLPRLIDYSDDDHWMVLVYEVVSGRAPSHPWSEDDLSTVVDGLDAMHEALTPCPVPGVESTAEYFEPMFCGWRRLAGMSKTPVLDDWSRRNLSGLANLEAGWAEAALGNSLVHGDVRSDNLLITESSVVFVDWPHASKGRALLDVLFWAPSLALEGGPDPESLLVRFPHRGADPDDIDAVVAAVSGFFTYHATLPPPPGLPTLRAFQAAQGEVGRAWLGRRTGLH